MSSSQGEQEFDAYMEALSTTYSWKAGHVLSANDITALEIVDKHNRDQEEGLTDTFHRGFQDGLRRGGGANIQALSNKIDELRVQLAAERGLRLMERQWGFREGAQRMRELLARFVEQGGDTTTATSIRLNWNPVWGDDPGPPPVHDDSPAFRVLAP